MTQTAKTDDLLAAVQTRDRHRLQQKLRRARNDAEHARAQGAIEKSAAVTAQRATARGEVSLVEGLPVTERADEIAKALHENQVVVVCGETGSGKTTQLPKILMQAGLSARGLIGHTQPRRLAARSVGQRIADELETPFGELVGFQTRFEKKLGETTQIKLMTDGILLAETQHDPDLERYEAIIIDEAHSSQSGKHADSMARVLADGELTEEEKELDEHVKELRVEGCEEAEYRLVRRILPFQISCLLICSHL